MEQSWKIIAKNKHLREYKHSQNRHDLTQQQCHRSQQLEESWKITAKNKHLREYKHSQNRHDLMQQQCHNKLFITVKILQ